MQTYTLSGIESMLGLSRSVITGLVAAGFVTPGRGPRREYRFSFQDVVLLRTAHGLQAANIPARKIVRSLQRLKATLPAELPLSGLRIAAVGNEVAVRDGDKQWVADSGQGLIDFDIKPDAGRLGSVTVLSRQRAAPVASAAPAVSGPPQEPASESFARAEKLEAVDKRQAERAYRQAIRQAPDYLDPYLNLGVLLCDSGRAAQAVDLYLQALQRLPEQALLHFNLAVALQDLGHDDEALGRYEACLRLAPAMADAHYNAALLHEQLGHPTKAIRHYSAYRRLQR